MNQLVKKLIKNVVRLRLRITVYRSPTTPRQARCDKSVGLSLSKPSFFIILFVTLFSPQIFAQDTLKIKRDSAFVISNAIPKSQPDTTKKSKTAPKKYLFKQAIGLMPIQPADRPAVAFMRAVVPSMGQFTNKQYWKMPIVLAAGTVGIGAIVYNGSRFRYYQNEAINLDSLSLESGLVYTVLKNKLNARKRDSDGNFVNVNDTPITISKSQLVTAAEGYRSYRDKSFIFFTVGYLVSGIEAYVAAHLKSFDMSDDITLRMKPKIQITVWGTTTYNLAFTINFK